MRRLPARKLRVLVFKTELTDDEREEEYGEELHEEEKCDEVMKVLDGAGGGSRWIEKLWRSEPLSTRKASLKFVFFRVFVFKLEGLSLMRVVLFARVGLQ